MKRSLVFMFMIVSTVALAQINPCAMGGQAHDRTVGYKVDRLPDDFDLGSIGDNNRWVFSGLKSATHLSYQFQEASKGRYKDYFPEADYVVRSANGMETYFYQDRNKWYKVGRAILKKGGIEPNIITFKVPLQACYAKVDQSSKAYGTSYEVTTEKNGIMESFAVRENYLDGQDAKGRLYLPQGIYDAYRVKREVSFMTELNPADAPYSIENYSSYLFIEEVTNELLMEVRLDPAGEIETVTFQADEGDIPTRSTVGPNKVTLYPSTSFGNIRLDFVNFNPGKYHFEVYNIIGKKLWSTVYDITDDVTIKEDLTNLPKGTYVYTILDRNRNTIVTRRLAIINP